MPRFLYQLVTDYARYSYRPKRWKGIEIGASKRCIYKQPLSRIRSILSTALNNTKFLYQGYRMAVFPDCGQTDACGWVLSEKLKSLRATIVNTESEETVCVETYLIIGVSPLAATEL